MLRSIPEDDWGHRPDIRSDVRVSPVPDFDVTCRRDGADMVIGVSGDVDLCTAPMVWDAIEQTLQSPVTGIVVDLEHLSFIDAAGLAVLVRANAVVAELPGRSFTIRGTPRFALRLFRLTGLDKLLVIDEPGPARLRLSGFERHDEDIVIGRAGRAVRVTCTAPNGAVQRARLREIVSDLIDGQGNLTIEIDLPAVTMVDLRLLEVLVESEGRVAARGGQLSVRTGSGSWEHASASAPQRDPDEP